MSDVTWKDLRTQINALVQDDEIIGLIDLDYRDPARVQAVTAGVARLVVGTVDGQRVITNAPLLASSAKVER